MIREGVLSQKSDATYSNISTCSDTRSSIDNIWVVSNIYLIKIQRYVESIQNFAHSTHIDATVAAKKVDVMMCD